MRVRIWISGSEGPSHDFELLDAPRAGERVTISVGGESLEGIVQSVSWQFQGIERSEGDLSLEGEPLGSVTLVHVICERENPSLLLGEASAEVDAFQGATH